MNIYEENWVVGEHGGDGRITKPGEKGETKGGSPGLSGRTSVR